MRFVGLSDIATFIAQCPREADAVRAWLAEMRHRTWVNAAALVFDFPNADAGCAPTVVFYLGPEAVQIETLIDFRNGVVLLTQIHRQIAIHGRATQARPVS